MVEAPFDQGGFGNLRYIYIFGKIFVGVSILSGIGEVHALIAPE